MKNNGLGLMLVLGRTINEKSTVHCGLCFDASGFFPFFIGPEIGEEASLGPAVQGILNAVFKTSDPSTIPNNNNLMVHCGKTKVFLTHAMVMYCKLCYLRLSHYILYIQDCCKNMSQLFNIFLDMMF